MKRAILFATLSIVLSIPAFCAPADYATGVQLYNARRYSQALGYFGNAARAGSNTVGAHYYMGLCYQGMNQMSLARKEYQWVASSGNDQQLRTQAQAALQQLSRYANSTDAAGTGGGTAASSAASSDPYNPGGGPAAPQKISGQLQILEFYTSNCPACVRFEPIWEETSQQMGGRVEFKRLNAEDQSNAALVKKYDVTNWPRLVFTDRTGNALHQEYGPPGSVAQFRSLIDQVIASHR